MKDQSLKSFPPSREVISQQLESMLRFWQSNTRLTPPSMVRAIRALEQAGNLALKIMATGGVYLGGGIAPKNLERFKGPLFMQGFLYKGRMQPLLEAMPVKIIINDRTALYGPALYLAAVKEGTAGRIDG